jgi:hypothetical protein
VKKPKVKKDENGNSTVVLRHDAGTMGAQRESWVSQTKTVKLTGEQLVKKGLVAGSTDKGDKHQYVVVSTIRPTPYRYVKTSVELSSLDSPGVFELMVKRPGADAEKTKVVDYPVETSVLRIDYCSCAFKSCSKPSTSRAKPSTYWACP